MEARIIKQEKPPRQSAFDLSPFVGVHSPDAASIESSLEMKVPCRYCKDDRAAYRIEGTWWHEVARGDAGQYEPCRAGKLRNAFWKSPNA
jgi:hypothetical protein